MKGPRVLGLPRCARPDHCSAKSGPVEISLLLGVASALTSTCFLRISSTCFCMFSTTLWSMLGGKWIEATGTRLPELERQSSKTTARLDQRMHVRYSECTLW